MQIRYIPAAVTLLAGAITSIISIVKKFDVIYSLKVLLIVLIVFYILGVIGQKIILAVMKNGGKVNNVDDEADMNSEEELEDNLADTKADSKTENKEEA